MSEEIKKRFRSGIKNETLNYLERQRRLTLKKFNDNKFNITRLATEQKELKKEAQELHRMIEEYKK